MYVPDIGIFPLGFAVRPVLFLLLQMYERHTVEFTDEAVHAAAARSPAEVRRKNCCESLS